MRKLVFKGTLALSGNNENLTMDDIQNALAQLGDFTITHDSQIDTADSSGLNNHVWLFIGPDDEEPILKVKDAGEVEGEELSSEEHDRLIEEGVCVGVVVHHPRADRHGFPQVASQNPDDEAAFPADYGFSVDLNVLDVIAFDTGDDAVQTAWLKIAVR